MICLLMNKICILWFIMFLNLYVPVDAQEISFVQLIEEPELTITSGNEEPVSLRFLIKEGYHIQAAEVKDENLIPSALSFDAPDGLKIDDPVFPQPDEFRMQGVEEVWHVYSDVLEVKIPVNALESMEEGVYTVNGKLYYQACDDFKCYFPRNFDFSMKINVK